MANGAAGDLLSQKLEQKLHYLKTGQRKHLDINRTLATAGYGAIVIGPIGAAWYHGLDSIVTKFATPNTPKFVGLKVLLDTVVFGPAHVAGFFAFVEKLNGRDWSDIGAKLKKDFVPTFAAETAFWVPLQYLNFSLIPVRHQLLVVNLATVVEAAGLSYMSNTSWTQILKAMGLEGLPGLHVPQSHLGDAAAAAPPPQAAAHAPQLPPRGKSRQHASHTTHTHAHGYGHEYGYSELAQVASSTGVAASQTPDI